MSKRKIVLLLPYFGVLPKYFNFYLKSLARMNFDVLFFSDLKVAQYPSNFKIVSQSFDECRELISRKIGRPVVLNSPRRLCDFKPMYGKIFEDYLTGYDYWAFGDCDLVYGRMFDEALVQMLKDDPDIVSLHKSFCSGPFCMVRNCEALNQLYLEADNFKEVCGARETQCVAFDELHGDWHQQLARGEMTIEECRRLGDSFTAIVMRTPGLRLYFEDVMFESELSHGEVVRMTSDGGLTIGDKEIPVFHYVRVKLRKYFTPVRADYNAIDEYLIDDAGFYVSSSQKAFRHSINLFRKSRAAVLSLKKNGLARLSPHWGAKD